MTENKTDRHPRKDWLYWLTWITMLVFGVLYHRLSRRGGHRIPATGPVLIVANHESNFDPFFIATAFTKRPMCFMAKMELFQSRIGNLYFSNVGAFPVDRDSGGDKRAIVQTLKLLRKNDVVLLFPEGTRTPDGNLGEFQVGAARLALSVPGTKIVPVRIKGAHEAFGRGRKYPLPRKIRVEVGDPFDPSEIKGLPDEKKSLYQAVTDEMVARISNL